MNCKNGLRTEPRLLCKCMQWAAPGQKLCRECKNAYVREWRKTHPLTPEQRKKDNARSYARQYMLRGHLEPEPCIACGTENAQMHHEDYDRPLDVIWLCGTDHRWLHNFYRERNNGTEQ